jgi:hypothetical protein
MDERLVNVVSKDASCNTVQLGRVINITLRYSTLVTLVIMPLPQKNKEYGTKEYW